MKKLIIKSCIVVLIAGVVLGYASRGKAVSGQLGQAPEPAQNASFLHTNSALKIIRTGTTTITLPNPTTLGSTITTSVVHNLGFAPYHTATVETDSGLLLSVPHQLATPTSGVGALPLDLDIDMNATKSYLQFQFTPITHLYDGRAFIFKYYIYDNVIEP